MNTFFVILSAVGIDSAVLDLIGRVSGNYNYVKGPSGQIYVAGYGPHNVPDSDTHITISVDQIPALAAQLPTLGKSVAISGIDNPEAFMAAFGLVRCDKDGSVFTGGEL
jgi:hypothetical protein